MVFPNFAHRQALQLDPLLMKWETRAHGNGKPPRFRKGFAYLSPTQENFPQTA